MSSKCGQIVLRLRTRFGLKAQTGLSFWLFKYLLQILGQV